ncbi:MAG TPA: PaaX family transcriptional regulator C-terminal domain-containing protein [Acidimicrobiales bacterium]|nr:PaaX family transcriptional regulator C-terminal domain-containing protein [Acidimicrobiales bacterium]
MSRTTVQVPTRVLVFGMARADGTIQPSEVLPVAEACGQSPDQIRSCLRRLVAEGLFVRRGAGRSGVYEATPRGLAALGASVERTRLAYAQDAAGRGWDRQWRLVGFAVPERNRSSRDAFRERLRQLGGSAIQAALYVSPHNWHKDVKAVAERLGVADQVTVATTDDLEIGGERDPRELARHLWQLDDLADRYRKFTNAFAHVPLDLAALRQQRLRLGDETFLPLALSMAVAFQDCFGRDPLLPPELLPRPWPGREARELVVTSRRQALAMRQASGLPPLFRLFDEAVEAIP